MKLKRIKLCFVCLISILCLTGCGSRSNLKEELSDVRLSADLPEVSVEKCRYLEEADDAVYEQQIAACELFYEAYDITRTSDFREVYKGKVKPERIAYYCNERRKELNLDISTQLHDNVYKIIKGVENCGNTDAYLNRVEYDTLTFYDYYAEYINADDTEEVICKILKTFHERSNILAFSFMSQHEDEFVDAALERIVKNSGVSSEYNVYISENNELIKALNTVYGGVKGEYASIITEANTRLIRKMLENDSDLDEDSINSLMSQLGEPTPEPTVEPTSEPTPEPTAEPTQKPVITIPPAYVTRPPVATKAPTPKPQTPQVNESYEFET